MLETKNLAEYNARSAANYVTNKIPIVSSSYTIGNSRKLIEKNIKQFETLDYVYVVEDNIL